MCVWKKVRISVGEDHMKLDQWHLYKASGLVKIGINASHKTGKVYKAMLSSQNANITHWNSFSNTK